MKKALILTLCLSLSLVSFAFAERTSDAVLPSTGHALTMPNAGPSTYTGTRSTPALLYTIDLSPVNGTGYCWGLTYDWERDALWVSQWSNTYPYLYAIQKTSPCTKIDSVLLGSGVPGYRLGLGYAGGDLLYMAGFDANIYAIDLSNGTGSVYRSLPWSGAEGLGYNVVDDAIYPADWTANQCAWAQPSQSGSWNTWAVTPYPSGMSGAFSASIAPQWLFELQEAAPAHFYQYALTAGVPNTTPFDVWDCDPGQTNASEADCAFDGQYIYVLDQSGPDKIWVYDIGLPPPSDTARWDFETGLQEWTNTNGLAFPGGWGVQASGLHATWTPPNAQDSSLWIDSDDYGTGTADTALSPLLIPNATTTNWLWYGLGYNYLSGDFVEVGIKYYDGATWTVAPLKTYSADFGPADDSVDVSAYNTYNLIQVYFYYYAPAWDWYAAVDNVTINGVIFHPSDDVGTIAIVAPGATEFPNTAIDPIATFKNFGSNPETFDVYFTIDSSGTQVYTDTRNIALGAGLDTTITFNTWTSGPNGVTYNNTAYTVLGGDSDPGNDTLTSTTTTASAFWKVYATMPQASYYNAAVYTDVTGTPTAYSLGGNTTYTSIFEFDCTTETWSTSSAVLNHEAQRDAAAVVGGKIYVMGGCDAGFTAHAFNQEYDPVAGTVTDKAALPTARYFNGALAWNDSLIYVIGGQAASYYNVVEIYDPASDTWTTGTALPIQNRSFACGIWGDTIYVTGGFNGSGYVASTYIGAIDPANPTNITWTTGPNIPVGPSTTPGRSRLQGACVQEKFYFTCGDDHGVAAYDTWYYDPADQLWHQDLDKPTPISNSQCAVFIDSLDSGTFFCAGGYNTATSAGTNATEGLINLVQGVAEEPGKTPTLVFGLSQNAPNPTRNGYTAISYTTTSKCPVSLKIYNSAGRLVRTLVDGSNLPAGTRTVYWDMRDNGHNAVAAGVYFYRLSAENRTTSKKMVVVK